MPEESKEELNIQHPEGDSSDNNQQGSTEESKPADPSSNSSSEGQKSEGGSAWYSKPEQYGNKAGEAISGTLGTVGQPVGTGLEYGTRPVGNIVDSVVGGVMRSGQVMNEAPEHGAGIEKQIRDKVGGLVGYGQEQLEQAGGAGGGKAQELYQQAQNAVETQQAGNKGGEGVNLDAAVGKAKEVVGQGGEQAGKGAEGVKQQAEGAAQKGSEGGQEALQQGKEALGQGGEGGQEALQQGKQTLEQSGQKLGELTGQGGESKQEN